MRRPRGSLRWRRQLEPLERSTRRRGWRAFGILTTTVFFLAPLVLLSRLNRTVIVYSLFVLAAIASSVLRKKPRVRPTEEPMNFWNRAVHEDRPWTVALPLTAYVLLVGYFAGSCSVWGRSEFLVQPGPPDLALITVYAQSAFFVPFNPKTRMRSHDLVVLPIGAGLHLERRIVGPLEAH
jgi:hypothetical protein